MNNRMRFLTNTHNILKGIKSFNSRLKFCFLANIGLRETKRKDSEVVWPNKGGGTISLKEQVLSFFVCSSLLPPYLVPDYRDAPTRRCQFREIARKIKWFKSGADRIKVKEPPT